MGLEDYQGMGMEEFGQQVGTGPAPDAKGHANVKSPAQQAVDAEVKQPRNPGMDGNRFESHGLN